MARRKPTPAPAPDWDALYEIAAPQQGHFTTAQAASAGYSPQLLNHYLRRGRITRVVRGVYRIVHFPPEESEHLVVIWLWSEQQGVFSHETALSLHDLSDVLPSKIHLTLPESWTRRRLRFPPAVVPHHAEIEPDERAWYGSVPVTTPLRTLLDCTESRLQPDLVRQVIDQGLRRGLFTSREVVRATRYVDTFGREA